MSFQKFTTFHEMERWLDENRVTEDRAIPVIVL